MNALITYAMDSLLESVEAVCNFFLFSGEEVAKRLLSVMKGCIEDFQSSCHRTYQGTEDLIEGLSGMMLAPAALITTAIAIPALAIIWVGLFALSAITHMATVPMVYAWVLYQRLMPKPQTQPINYFPEVESLEPTPERVTAFSPPILVMSALTVMAGMGVEMPPVIDDWSPSYIPAETMQEANVEIDTKTFRKVLERQFGVQPRQTWEEYILQHLALPSPTTQIESIESEVERSLPLEVSTAPEFPAKPNDRILQRWDKKQLVVFCDRLNAVKKGSIKSYKKASKSLLIKKIKEFYA